MYKAILFDLDGTLIDFDACVQHAVREAFRGVGLTVDDGTVWNKIWAAYAPISALYWGRRAEEGWSREQVTTFTMRDTLAALGADERRTPALTPFLAPDVAAAYWDAFCRTAYLNPGAREILERLAPHFKLGLVTNGDSDAQRGRIEAGKWSYLQSVIISDEAGVAKPAREIFDLALSKLGIDAREALYIGDSIEHDHTGARNAGIDFCYYQPNEQRHKELRPTFRVRDLRELGCVLGLT